MHHSVLASSHAITSDVSVLETMKAAEFFQSDGVILTGGATGWPPSACELQGALQVLRRSYTLAVHFCRFCFKD